MLNEARKDLSELDNKKLNKFLVALADKYVQAEVTFIKLLFAKGGLEDLTQEQLVSYIEFLGKYRLFQLGLIGSLDVPENPLEWMDWLLSGSKHDNFFEKKVTDYSHSKLVGKIDYSVYLAEVN